MTQNGVAIHWFTGTRPVPEQCNIQELAFDTIHAIEGQYPDQACTPYPRNYSHGWLGKFGTVSYHPQHKRMGVCYNLTGDACERFYDDLGTLTPIIMKTRIQGIRASRIDMAIDIPEECDIGAIPNMVEEQPNTTRARVCTPYDEITTDGKTSKRQTTGVYIGSRLSKRFVIVYNKALQAELWGELKTRIELRNKKVKARQASDMIAQYGLADSTRSLIRDYADLPITWWQEALAGPLVEIPPIGKPETDTVAWLIDQVAPVLNRELKRINDPSSRLYMTYANIIANNTPITRE